MNFHEPTKNLLDQICTEEGINAFNDSYDRERLVAKALVRLGFHAEAEAMLAIGRPKKGQLSRKETLAMMKRSRDPALRFLAEVLDSPEPPLGPATWQREIYRMIKKRMALGETKDQAAWHLHNENLVTKAGEVVEYRDIKKAYEREHRKTQKD